MKMKYLWIGVAVLFLSHQLLSENCPNWSEKDALLEFLQAHRSNSLEADRDCVRRAFSALKSDKKYLEVLVSLLDFEQPLKRANSLVSRSTQYPAIDALAQPAAEPYLIKAIKEAPNDTVLTNAAEALELIHSRCGSLATTTLQKEMAKSDTTAEQREHLQQAITYITEHLGSEACTAALSGQRPSQALPVRIRCATALRLGCSRS